MPKISVGVRVKPEDPKLVSKSINIREDVRQIDLSISGGKHEFQFDKIFNSACSQEHIFLQSAPVIDQVLEGFNGCILTYGQTGAGNCDTCLLIK